MTNRTRAGEPGGILFSSVTAAGPGPGGRETDLWYFNRYLPALAAALPGAPSQRYASPARGSFTAVFELASPHDAGALVRGATDSAPAAPDGIAIERFVGEPIGLQKRPDCGTWNELVATAPVTYAVFFKVPPARETEFHRWYDEEHVPMLLANRGWPACRRFRLVTPHPGGFTHLALHYVTDLRALESPEREAAVATPWRARLVAEGWFKGEYRLCHRLA